MDLYLLRHGQSQYNVGLTDYLDSDLTDIGREQAQRTGERLAGENLTRIFVSPLRRALQTIAPTCALTGLPAHLYPDVCEYFSSEIYDEFPGLSPQEIERRYPFTALSADFPCSDIWWPQAVEDTAVIAARCVRVRDAILALYGQTDDRILLVSHAETVGRLIEAFQRVPPDPVRPPWSDNCGLSRLHCPRDNEAPATPIYINATDHLGDAV